jgi:hypothetical protein
LQNLRQKLTNRIGELEEVHKLGKLLDEWIAEMELKVIRSEVGDISETRAELEKFRTLSRQVNAQNELVSTYTIFTYELYELIK